MPPSLSPRQQLVQRWLQKASSDLESARWLLQRNPPPADTACFHCQQATEKALKAVLVHHAIPPPRTHSLDSLFRLCEPHASALGALRTSIAWIEIYGVETRYPDSPSEPTLHDAQQAMQAADQAYAAVIQHLPPEVHP
jgi:HEPN domain-containing protein